MLDVALDLAGQDDVVIVDGCVNIRATQNGIAVEQIGNRILDPPVGAALRL